jgi:peroxiredoxin
VAGGAHPLSGGFTGPDQQVLVVNNGDEEATRRWSTEAADRFPVLAQTQFSLSKKYEVYATPFAFLIDEKGVIASKSIINSRQHIRYVLSGKRAGGHNGHAEAEAAHRKARSRTGLHPFPI